MEKTKKKINKFVIIAIAIVLVISIALIAILVPLFLNRNIKFDSEDELFSYIEGVYRVRNKGYYIFEDNKLIDIYEYDCGNYLHDYFVETHDIASTKGMKLSGCDKSIKSKYGEVIKTDCYPDEGQIVIYPDDYPKGITLNIKKDGLFAENEEIYLTKEGEETKLSSYSKFVDAFESVKTKEYKMFYFVPVNSELKENILENKDTNALINNASAFKSINDLTKYDVSTSSVLFVLGQATYNVNSFVIAENDEYGYITKLTLIADDVYLDSWDLIDIISVYLQEWPLYPEDKSEAREKIIDKMYEPTPVYSENGYVRTAEFDLFGVHFYTIVQEKYSHDYYYISLEPKDFSLADY